MHARVLTFVLKPDMYVRVYTSPRVARTHTHTHTHTHAPPPLFRYFCSSYVAVALQIMGVMDTGVEPRHIVPADFVDDSRRLSVYVINLLTLYNTY